MNNLKLTVLEYLCGTSDGYHHHTVAHHVVY